MKKERFWIIAMFVAIVCGLERFIHLRSLHWAPGLDGGYYFLQVQSLQQGTPLFNDSSLLFSFLVPLANATGDVVLGNEIALSLFCALILFS